jgi:Ca2+-binding EF-hand superfamily protein
MSRYAGTGATEEEIADLTRAVVSGNTDLENLPEYMQDQISLERHYSDLFVKNFTQVDRNLDGLVGKAELQSLNLGLSAATLDRMYTLLDTNNDGNISALEAISRASENTSFGMNSVNTVLSAVEANTLSAANALEYIVRLSDANATVGGPTVTRDEVAGVVGGSVNRGNTASFVQSKFNSSLGRSATSDELTAIQDLYSRGELSNANFEEKLYNWIIAGGGAPTGKDSAGFQNWQNALINSWIQQNPNRDYYSYLNPSLSELANQLADSGISYAELSSRVRNASIDYGDTGLWGDNGPITTPTWRLAGGGFTNAPGVSLVGEQGPELLATGPSRVWSFENTQKMLTPEANTDDELLEEIRKLNTKIQKLEETIARGDIMNAEATERNTREVSKTLKDTASTTTYAQKVQNRVTS